MLNSDRERFDIGSVTSALRLHPDDFAMQGRHVLHLSTGLQFTFEPTDRTAILNFRQARRISLLRFHPKDQPDLYQAFEQWHSSYWQIIKRNEGADSPFVPRGWKRLRRKIKDALLRSWNTPDLPIIPGA
jgi:hypothetical protein